MYNTLTEGGTTRSAALLGTELGGLASIISAPRRRLGALMTLTVIICIQGTVSPALLSSLSGLWVHALLFRLPALAWLNHCFQDARRSPSDRMIGLSGLSRRSLCELSSLGSLNLGVLASACLGMSI